MTLSQNHIYEDGQGGTYPFFISEDERTALLSVGSLLFSCLIVIERQLTANNYPTPNKVY